MYGMIMLLKEVGFRCPPSIGKLQRQRFGEKERGHLFKNYTILEERQASVSEPFPLKHPKKTPHHLLPD